MRKFQCGLTHFAFGVGGAPTDVFTPVTQNPDNVVLGIFNKMDQAPNIILNLNHTPVRAEQLGDILSRVNSFDPSSPGRIQSVLIIKR
jgi:hypothetical protein